MVGTHFIHAIINSYNMQENFGIRKTEEFSKYKAILFTHQLFLFLECNISPNWLTIAHSPMFKFSHI